MNFKNSRAHKTLFQTFLTKKVNCTLFDMKYLKAPRARPKERFTIAEDAETVFCTSHKSKIKTVEAMPSLPQAKKPRTNWSISPNRERLEKAVSDWDGKKGDRLDSKKKGYY